MKYLPKRIGTCGWVLLSLAMGTCMPSEYTRKLFLLERLCGGYVGATLVFYSCQTSAFVNAASVGLLASSPNTPILPEVRVPSLTLSV
jgi:hypothetical protein